MDGGIHSPSPVASVNGQVGNVELTGDDILPSQTGNSGKVLGTNGSSVSWVAGGSGSGAVDSVNGETGTVVLTQDDIQDGTTYKQYSQTEKTKLAGIASGAEVNVNADWDSVSGDSQILNKPTLGTAAATDSTDYATAAQGALADTALQSIVAGTNVSIDDTDPQNPIISAAGSGSGDMLAATYDPTNKESDAFSQDNMVDGTTNKNYTAAEKTKLSGIATGATANDTDANLKNRANHTGTQTASTISDFSTAADARITAATGVSVQGYNANTTTLGNSTTGTGNIVRATSPNITTPTGIVKGDVGLGNVDNTSDANKPVSTATQSALDLKANLSILTSETINQNSTLVAFGDSITAGTGASSSSNRYINKFAAYKGWTLTNNGLSGARLNDAGITDAIYATTTSDTGNYSLMCGTNNMHLDDQDAAYQDSFRENLGAVLAWLAIPDGDKQKAINRTSETGTWTTNASTIYGGMGKKSTTNASTMTFTAYGSTVYIGYIKTNSGAGEFKVTIDGNDMATVSTVGSVDTRAAGGGAYGAALVRIPNLMNVVHTVVITVTSSTSSSNTVFIDWVSGNGTFKKSTGPNVWCGNVILGSAASYVAHGGSNSSVGQYNAVISGVISDLARDGLRITPVDSINAVDLNTDMDADGIHPNDTGHDNLSKAFIAASSSVVNPHDRGGASLVPTRWIAPTMLNSWVNFGSGWENAAFMKDGNGTVFIKGMVKSGTIGNVPVFILPPGFRPNATTSFATRSNNLFGYMEIYNNGEVRATSGNNAHFSMACSFKAGC